MGFEEIGRTDKRVRSDGSVIVAPDGTSGRHDSEVQISVRCFSFLSPSPSYLLALPNLTSIFPNGVKQ